MKISAKTKFCIVVGDPIDHSLSPAIHNAAYKSLGIDDQFVYLGTNVKVENIEAVVKAMRNMKNFCGLACTMPHKIEVIKHLDEIDEIAKKIGAVNTVVNNNGVLKGYNTDWLGIVTPLEQIIKLKNKKVAVLGAGGAARAVVYGMILKGAKPTIFNRTVEKAQELGKEFACNGVGLDDVEGIKDFDIIINSTAVGMHPLENKTPIPTRFINESQVVFDIVYIPYETKLLREAKKKGAKTIHGIEMLLYQGTAQFELFTNHKAPVKVMRKILNKNFKL